eukprot:COSAG05_NODE_344_length_11005_cov_35.313772_13_plen_72_part_00
MHSTLLDGGARELSKYISTRRMRFCITAVALQLYVLQLYEPRSMPTDRLIWIDRRLLHAELQPQLLAITGI